MDPKKGWEGLLSLDGGGTEFEYKRIFGLAGKQRKLCCNGPQKFPEKLQRPASFETEEEMATGQQDCGRTAAEHGI